MVLVPWLGYGPKMPKPSLGWRRIPGTPLLYRDALAIAEAGDRIPTPNTLDRAIFNFWQDSNHVRGIWRKTTPESYLSASPEWITVLDLDALAKTEKANWVMQGTTCAELDEHHCMLSLSDGGEDAATAREFDIPSSRFARHDFVLPHGKQEVIWVDERTLLTARE
jgi:prolyl oligopeptidase